MELADHAVFMLRNLSFPIFILKYMAGAAKNAAPAITIGIEMDSELLEQLMEIIEPMGLTPEMLIRRFLEWCVSPAIKDESNGYESWSVLLYMSRLMVIRAIIIFFITCIIFFIFLFPFQS